jgi:hypothetical protein
MIADNKAIGKFFDLQKKNYEKCLHVGFLCEKKPIRAHSIQNAKVLDLLQENNHVLMPLPKLTPDKEPTIEFCLVGRNSASTFTGLCSEHDAELFRLADNEPLDVKNEEQLGQFAYRAIMRELHTCAEAAYRFQLMHIEAVKSGEAKQNEPTAPGLLAVAFWERGWRVIRYRGSYFDSPMAKGKKPVLGHHVIELGGQKPTVAASSLFSVEHDKAGDIVGPTLNVIPTDATKTVAVFSYPRKQAKAIRKGLSALFDADENKQKSELSKVILQRVENFVLAPAFYNSWSEEKRMRVSDVFEECLMKPKELPDNVDISLF